MAFFRDDEKSEASPIQRLSQLAKTHRDVRQMRIRKASHREKQFTLIHPKEYNMTVLTTHEQQEIDRANTEGKQPVVFVHGLYLLASSWDNWRALFQERGYTTLAPGWPDDPETVADANEDPEVFANK